MQELFLEGKLWDSSTWTLFSDHFGSKGLLWQTIFEIGSVLSENRAAVIRKIVPQCNPLGHPPVNVRPPNVLVFVTDRLRLFFIIMERITKEKKGFCNFCLIN